MLKIDNLTKKYQEKDKFLFVIKRIDAEIKVGESIVFLGPNGCGKTTLLKCIAGLIKPTSGQIYLNERLIIKSNKQIGMVFQDFSLFPWLDVKKNISFGLKLNKLCKEEIKKKLEHYLKLTNLVKFKDKYPKELSGGMKQKVAIARTLITNPEIILMDEPFSALDLATKEKMQEFLLKIKSKEKKTTIFITHDIEEAIFLADKIYILSKRPSKIIKEINIKFTRPRDKKLRSSKEFIKMKLKLAKYLS